MMIEGVPGSKPATRRPTRSIRLEEMKHYGLHRHFTGGTSVLMFGGGVKKGFQLREHGRRTPLHRGREPGERRGPARDDLPRDGHLPEDRLRRRESPVLRDQGRQGRTAARRVRLAPPIQAARRRTQGGKLLESFDIRLAPAGGLHNCEPRVDVAGSIVAVSISVRHGSCHLCP